MGVTSDGQTPSYHLLRQSIILYANITNLKSLASNFVRLLSRTLEVYLLRRKGIDWDFRMFKRLWNNSDVTLQHFVKNLLKLVLV